MRVLTDNLIFPSASRCVSHAMKWETVCVWLCESVTRRFMVINTTRITASGNKLFCPPGWWKHLWSQTGNTGILSHLEHLREQLDEGVILSVRQLPGLSFVFFIHQNYHCCL